MTVGECTTYARDYFRLEYPVDWVVRENRLVGLTDFCPPGNHGASYPPGIALITIPETGMPLDVLLRTGLFFLTRDLDSPAVERMGELQEGRLAWYHLNVRGRSIPLPRETVRVHVVKRVALCRPGPGVLALALYGPLESIEPLQPAFDALRRSLEIVR